MFFDKGVTVKINDGAFEVDTPDICITTDRRMSLSAGELKINAEEGEAAVDKLTFQGLHLTSSWNTIKLAARNIDTVAERLIQKFNRKYKTVKEFEENKIGRLRYLVKGMFFIKTKNTTVLAEKTVKIDGDKISLG